MSKRSKRPATYNQLECLWFLRRDQLRGIEAKLREAKRPPGRPSFWFQIGRPWDVVLAEAFAEAQEVAKLSPQEKRRLMALWAVKYKAATPVATEEADHA